MKLTSIEGDVLCIEKKSFVVVVVVVDSCMLHNHQAGPVNVKKSEI